MHVATIKTDENFDFGDFLAEVSLDPAILGCFYHDGTFYVLSLDCEEMYGEAEYEAHMASLCEHSIA